MRISLSALALACLATAAQAQTTAASAPQPAPPARGLPADLALEAATTALDTCLAQDQKVGVSVLDSSGELRRPMAHPRAGCRTAR